MTLGSSIPWVKRFLAGAVALGLAGACSSGNAPSRNVGTGGTSTGGQGAGGASTGGSSGISSAGAGGVPESCPTGQTLCGAQCVDTQTDPAHCGQCATACGTNSACVAGVCACSQGQTSCPSGCADTQTDPNNCGACSTVCGGGQQCSGGTCGCASGSTLCSGLCTDVSSDPSHCGNCTTACSADQTCTSGQCTCKAGLSQCGTACVDLQSDATHCGACTTACSSSQVCSVGSCGTSCASGLTQCGQSCVDLQTTAAHCGSCATACAADQTCQAGACTCATGQTDCSGTCADLTSDADHCGSCDTQCTGGRQCLNSTCQCPAGTASCGSACVDVQTNPSNCGACGIACASGSSCVAGKCTCPTGQTSCGGTCANLQTDPNNCGACGTTCPTGVCNAGVCPRVKDCVVKTFLTSPQFTNFDNYDGTTAVSSWSFYFNGLAGQTGAVLAGPYQYGDGTGSQLLSMVAGNASTYAINIANSQASAWGGALAFWSGCVDASGYQGISFWVKATAPTGKVNFSLAMPSTYAPDSKDPAGGGTCTTGCAAPAIDVAVTTNWTQLLIPWSSFTAGTGNGATVTPNGDNITGFTFNVPLNWVASTTTPGTYVPVAAPINLSVDDIRFIEAGACTGGTTLCGTGCVNTQTNNLNCGKCNNACTGARTCQAGVCTCPSGYTDCGGNCVNLKIDAQNCGACGTACSGVCSNGTCSASTCTANMPQQNKTSTSGATIDVGKYYISNNQWGASGASGSQSIWDTCQSGNTIGWGTSWNWSGGSNSQVKSYASAVLGWHWGWHFTPATTGLPVQLNSGKTVTCSWTFRAPTSGTFDVSYDLFAHAMSNPGTNDNPTDEIMIWLNRTGGAGPIGGTAATPNLAGTSWELHRGSNGNWNVFSYVRTTNTASATLNIMEFLGDLVNRGWMVNTKYLTSIESGTEVFVGSGELDTDTYYCTTQ